MLIVVSIAHFMSWLPLNVVNVIMTTFDSEETPLFHDVENLFITYAICHMASMTSAISNPILYGYMNENFRAQFRKIRRKVKTKLFRTDSVDSNPTGRTNNFRMSTFRRQASENMVTCNGLEDNREQNGDSKIVQRSPEIIENDV